MHQSDSLTFSLPDPSAAAPLRPCMLHPATAAAPHQCESRMIRAFANPALEAAFRDRYGEKRLRQDGWVLIVRGAGVGLLSRWHACRAFHSGWCLSWHALGRTCSAAHFAARPPSGAAAAEERRLAGCGHEPGGGGPVCWAERDAATQTRGVPALPLAAAQPGVPGALYGKCTSS